MITHSPHPSQAIPISHLVHLSQWKISKLIENQINLIVLYEGCVYVVQFILCYSLRGEQGYFCGKSFICNNSKASDTHLFHLLLLTNCISVFNVVCMSRNVLKSF